MNVFGCEKGILVTTFQNKMHTSYKIINIVLFLMLFLTFFYMTIPVPVESIDGAKDVYHYELGGFYFTSILYQIQVGNYIGSSLLGFMFVILFAENYFIFGKDSEDGNKKCS